MANFNLNDYETVEARIARFYADNPNGRIITKNLTTLQDRQVSTWVVQAKIYVENPAWVEDPSRYVEQYVLKATGLAFEIDGTGMANKTSALENAETSAIGRALANAGYSGNKRTSRQEMEKVERDVTPKAPARNWLNDADVLHFAKDKEGLKALYNEAKAAGVAPAVLEKIVEYGQSLA